MSFPFFAFMKNTRCSNTALDKALNIVYNEFTRRFPTKKGRDGFFTLCAQHVRLCVIIKQKLRKGMTV